MAESSSTSQCSDDLFYVSPQEGIILRVLYGIILTGEIGNLIACIYITFAYLIKRKVKSSLILMFYAFAYLVIIGYITSLVSWLINPSKMFYCYNDKPSVDVSTIAKISADCALDALGFVVLVTMYQITLSI